MYPTRFELYGTGNTRGSTTFSPTVARRWIANGRKLAATLKLSPDSTFGRYVIEVRPNPDGDTPFKTKLHPALFRVGSRQEGARP